MAIESARVETLDASWKAHIGTKEGQEIVNHRRPDTVPIQMGLGPKNSTERIVSKVRFR